MTDYVLVHGAWGGGWAYDRLARELTTHGHRVLVAQLTGLGTRAAELNPAITLTTHIDDVTAQIADAGFDRFVLCGHSWGGMVITGVATRLGGRIDAICYIDAFLPADGQSLSPGRSVDLTIVVQRRDNSLTIPRQAVLDATAAPKVLVVGADDRVTAREVSILRWPSTNAIITGGLKAGDRIVRDPAKVAQGGRIRPVVVQQGR